MRIICRSGNIEQGVMRRRVMRRRVMRKRILLSTMFLLLCFQVRSQDTDTIDPSGVWSNHEGTLSLLLTGDALSFSYSSVFGEAAHICSGAGVAGLEGQDIYHNVDEQGTIAFDISNDKVRMYVVEGIPSFCGSGWAGATFYRNRFTAPKLFKVKAKKSRFYVVMPSPPWERKGYVVLGNVVEVVPIQHEDAEQYVLARYRGKHAFSVGLLTPPYHGVSLMRSTPRNVCTTVFIAIVLSFTAASAQNFSNSWDGIGFDTPIEFSAPAKLGLNAVSLSAPPESAPGESRMEITLVAVPPDMAESMENDTELILGYLKGTFLATGKPGTKIESRSFLGKSVEGEGVSSTIPKPGELAYYLVPLQEGAMMLIALRWDQASTTEDAAAVLDMIAGTLKEIPQPE